MADPELSVIVPTLDRGELLHDTLRQVLAQPFSDIELVVVDQSGPEQSAANRAAIDAMDDPRLRYLHVGVKGLPNARNEGMAVARGKVWLFLDDDVILLGDVLGAHVRAYADLEVGGVSGRIVERTVRPNTASTRNEISAGGRVRTNLWGQEPVELATLKGANMSYRAQACRQVGGFDRRYAGTALLEDADYSTRVRSAGWRLRFEPRAELVHLSSPSGGVRVEDALRTEYWRFHNCCYFVAKNRGPAFLPPMLATFFAIAVKRAVEWRRPSAVPELLGALARGLGAWREGPLQDMPSGSASGLGPRG